MKILVDAHIFDHSYQGTQTYIKGLYNEIINEPNMEVVICARDIANLKIHFPDPKFQFVPLKSTSKWRRLGIELPLLCMKHKVDFAHFQYIVPFFKTTRFVTTIHDILFYDYPLFFPRKYRFINSFLFKRSAKKSNVVFTVSNYSKNAIIRHFKINSSKIVITPNAISQQIDPIPLSNMKLPAKYILYVSRFEPRKNQIGLLDSYNRLNLHLEGYHLVFIGSKKEKIEIDYFNLLKYYLPGRLNASVHFLENLTTAELVNAYQKASCFVYPSFAEGFGIPPLEAAVSGTKVLCSNTTSMNDFKFFKYQFDPKNEKEFDENLALILNDKSYPFEDIKQKILNQFNWKTSALKAINSLKEALNR